MNYLFGPFPGGRMAVALLLGRLVCGLGMALHGWEKAHRGYGFHWGDTISIAPGNDLHILPFFQGLATLSELGGGMALIFGLLTPLASLGIVSTMAFAIVSFHLGKDEPFVNLQGGGSWELNALYLVIPLALVFSGPGKISLDWLLFGPRMRPPAQPV